MTSALIVLHSEKDRKRAAKWAMELPWLTRITFQETKRTLPQNDKFWAMLTDVSRQHEHHGVKYPPETWKLLFMSAMGKEIHFIPTLEGTTFLPIGLSSSKLSVSEMADLIEFMYSWGADNNIEWSEPKGKLA